MQTQAVGKWAVVLLGMLPCLSLGSGNLHFNTLLNDDEFRGVADLQPKHAW